MKKCVVGFEGSSKLLVWRSPICITEMEVIINVPFGYEAVVVKDSIIFQTLIAGTHTIKNKNREKISVYFISVATIYRVNWGTPNQVTMMDKFLGIPITFGAHGDYGIKVKNSRKLLDKVIGNTQGITIDELIKLLRGIVLSLIKDTLTSAVISEQCSFCDINSKLGNIGNTLKCVLCDKLDALGLEVVDFVIQSIVADEQTKLNLYNAEKEQLRSANIQNIPNTRYCCSCGCAINFDALVCSNCGNHVEPITECDNCGNYTNNDARFCPKCGNEFATGGDN